MNEDDESIPPTESTDPEETTEGPELRTDGGQTIASTPATGGPSGPQKPSRPTSPDGPVLDGSSSEREASSLVLQPFQELCGRLERIHRSDLEVIVDLSSGTLRFPTGSEEAKICTNELAGKEGEQVKILRTPSAGEPLFVAFE